ncbi:MAG: hypothetical protein ACR2JM_14950 [Mycobacterium sp.]
MHDVNWWLMVLAFLLGLLLTFAMMIRKVTREVPVSHTISAAVKTPEVRKPDLKADLGKVAATGAAVAGGAAAKLHGAAEKVEKAGDTVEHAVKAKIDDVLEHEPYGAGSIRVSRRSLAPAGYTIKGDKDTGRYFTVDAPDYESVEAEVWFANEESAEKAGFLRWDAKGEHHVAGLTAAAAAVITETHTGDASLVVVEGASAGTVRAVSIDEVEAGRFGKGSAQAGADGSGPAGWLIKGNADSMLFHGPDSPAYEQTIAEVWFFDEATARAAGFDKWDKNFK